MKQAIKNHRDKEKRYRIYDFKRPDKFTRENIRAISELFESFSRLNTTMLSSLCRTVVHVHVASVDQLTYEEFIRSIPTPTSIAIINPDGVSKINWIMEVDPSITFAIIERLLGGEGDSIKYQHELTDVEQSLIEDVFIRMLGNLRETWLTITDLRPRLGAIETNPQFCQVVPCNEMIVLVTCEVKVGEIEGMLNVMLPYTSLTSVIPVLDSSKWFGDQLISTENPPRPELVKDITIPLKVVSNVANLRIKTLKNLISQGGTIRFSKDMKLTANNLIIADVKATDKNRVEITKLINKTEEIKMVDREMGTIDDVKVKVTCELGSTYKTVKEIKKFVEGSIIDLDTLSGDVLNVYANNVLIAKGEVIVADENFSVRLTETIDELRNTEDES